MTIRYLYNEAIFAIPTEIILEIQMRVCMHGLEVERIETLFILAACKDQIFLLLLEDKITKKVITRGDVNVTMIYVL